MLLDQAINFLSEYMITNSLDITTDGVNCPLMILVLVPRNLVTVMSGLLDKYLKMIYIHYVRNRYHLVDKDITPRLHQLVQLYRSKDSLP